MATDYSEFNARKRSGNSAGAAQRDNGSASSSQTPAYRNAVLDDYELQAGLSSVNAKFGDFCTRVAGEAWGLPLIDQKTKALITIAVDVVNQERGKRPHGGPCGHGSQARRHPRGDRGTVIVHVCLRRLQQGRGMFQRTG